MRWLCQLGDGKMLCTEKGYVCLKETGYPYPDVKGGQKNKLCELLELDDVDLKGVVDTSLKFSYPMKIDEYKSMVRPYAKRGKVAILDDLNSALVSSRKNKSSVEINSMDFHADCLKLLKCLVKDDSNLNTLSWECKSDFTEINRLAGLSISRIDEHIVEGVYRYIVVFSRKLSESDLSALRGIFSMMLKSNSSVIRFKEIYLCKEKSNIIVLSDSNSILGNNFELIFKK